MLYAYIKRAQTQSRFVLSRRFSRGISVVFFLSGLVLISYVVVPIGGSYLSLLPQYSSEIVSPLSSYFLPTTPGEVQAAALPSSDSYRPSTWFVAPRVSPRITDLRAYTISIPRLKIKNATVIVGGDDLKKSLIAWPTAALPGSYGVAIVFGHSQLPSFGGSGDFSGIFTFLMDLREGDEIFVDSDGSQYKYVVFDKKVVEPTNLSVLEQRFDRAYLTLVTCVPPGTLWKRGVIRAALEKV